MKNFLRTLDLLFSALETLSEVDYVALGQSAIRLTATVTAVVAALCSYLWLACQLWWDSHGEAVTVGLTRLAFGVVDLAGELLLLGRETRSAVNRLVAVASDRAFYALAGA